MKLSSTVFAICREIENIQLILDKENIDQFSMMRLKGQIDGLMLALEIVKSNL